MLVLTILNWREGCVFCQLPNASMASSMPPRGLRVGGSLRRRAFSVTTCDRGFASGISCFLLLPGSGAGRSHHPVYRWRSERLRQQAFRVRGSAPFGLVSQVAAYVAQVPHVPFGGACLPDVLNLQISVALQMSSLDGFDLCYSSLHRPGFEFTRIQDRF